MKTHTRLLVKKFGGTSVGSLERIEAVADRVLRDMKHEDAFPVLVVSAMAGETNRLVRLAETIYPFYRGMAYDMLLASGEQASIALLAMALEKRGRAAVPLLAHQVGIYTDSVYSKARITAIKTDTINRIVEQKAIPVIAGFQGVNAIEHITTLGRGGSDTTAVAIAAALQAEACEIYTDVPAVFSADPRVVPKAREIPRLGFEEMMEMASLGSKVLHFRCVELARKFSVRVHVRSTFEDREGTWVVPEGKTMEAPVVSAVTHEAQTTIFKIFPIPFGTEVLAKLFTSLGEKGVVVDIITQSEHEEGQRLAFSVNAEDLPNAKTVLESQGFENKRVEVISGVAKISVIGVGMRNHPGVAAKFFEVLAAHQVTVHLVTTSEIKISAVIDADKLNAAVNALHQSFDLDQG